MSGFWIAGPLPKWTKPLEWLQSDLRFWLWMYRHSIQTARALRLEGGPWRERLSWLRQADGARGIVLSIQREIRRAR
jgi:hypothetical protein